MDIGWSTDRITNRFYNIKCIIKSKIRGLGYRGTRLKNNKTITQG